MLASRWVASSPTRRRSQGGRSTTASRRPVRYLSRRPTPTAALMVVLVAALVGCVFSAPQTVFKVPEAAESFEATPELFHETVKQEYQPGDGTVMQGPRIPARHDIEDSEADDTLPLTYTSAEDMTSSELLPDLLRKNIRGVEAGEVTTKTNDSAEKVDVETERKLPGLLPPDLAETEGPEKPIPKGEAEIIAEIESILGKVREQYDKNGQPIAVQESVGDSSEGQAAQSISDFLKLSASQVDDETEQEDPVIEEARKKYMSVWNQEADRLNAPYMRVTKVWPEIGIVYMPVVTEVTDQIKASEAVKEAAAAFKSVWEERVTEEEATKASVEPMLKVLNNFMSAWLWAETTDEETAAGVVDEVDLEKQPPKKTDVNRYKAEKRLQVPGTNFLQNDFINDLESQLGKLYENIFNTRQPQQNSEPSGDTKSDLINTLGSGKLMLSCSVVPGYEDSLADAISAPADDPNNNNIPVDNPIADIRPIIDPFSGLNSVKRSPPTSTRPFRQETAEQDRLLTANRPFSDPYGAVRPFKDHIGVSRPIGRPYVSPVAYSEPFVSHEVDIRPITHPEAAAKVARYNYKGGTTDYRHPLISRDASIESEEAFARRYASQQPWRQYSWLH